MNVQVVLFFKSSFSKSIDLCICSKNNGKENILYLQKKQKKKIPNINLYIYVKHLIVREVRFCRNAGNKTKKKIYIYKGGKKREENHLLKKIIENMKS